MGTKSIDSALIRCCSYRVQTKTKYKYHKTYSKVTQRTYLPKTYIFPKIFKHCLNLKIIYTQPKGKLDQKQNKQILKCYEAIICLRDASVTYLNQNNILLKLKNSSQKTKKIAKKCYRRVFGYHALLGCIEEKLGRT